METKQVLDSWKEICAYLKRSEKTCRKWEHELGLPIHRIEDSPKARVFAYKEELDRWMTETQHSEKKSFFTNTRLKKLFVPTSILLAAVIIAVTIWQLSFQKETVPIPIDKPSLAVLYFENISEDENLDGWRTGLSELITTDLAQSKFINVLSGNRIYSILKKLNLLEVKKYSTEDLLNVAHEGRANHIINGSFIEAAGNIIINVMLQNPHTGEVVSTRKVECKGETEIASKVDELTRQIKLDLNMTLEQIGGDIDKSVEQITTSSPDALKYYIEGRKYLNKGDYRKSIQLMERAVEIDPEFAMAYRSLSVSYRWLFLFKERTEYITKALELSDRLPERERFQIMGDYYSYTEKTYDKAIEAYNRLLELYPDDIIGNNNLGRTYRILEHWDKAIEKLEVAKKYKSELNLTYIRLATSYRAKRMYDKAKEVLEYYLANFEDIDAIHRELAVLYIEQERLDLALAEADKAFILNPNGWQNIQLKGDIYLYQGDLAKAEEEYQSIWKVIDLAGQVYGRGRVAWLYNHQGKYIEAIKIVRQLLKQVKGQKVLEGMCHVQLARTYYASGNLEEALKECEGVFNTTRETDFVETERFAFTIKVRVLLEMDSIVEAQRTANELKMLIEGGLNERIIRFYHHLAGCIELKKKNFPQAIEQMQKALSLESFGPPAWWAFYIDSLAAAYFVSGDLEKALEEYKRITHLTTGRLFFGDIYAKSFYMLGKIYEQTDQKAKAVEHYEKFLNLWKDADPGLVEVEDARKRLARLEE